MTSVQRALSVGTLVLLGASAARAQPSQLFISEYIEGSSDNKALEIYNGTGAPINLATGDYNVQMYFNGSAAAGLTIDLTGTVAAGDVYVVAHSSSSAAILAQADQASAGGWFNGDDAVVLRRGTTIIDVIGQIGFDPGTEWGSGLQSTTDNTIRRKAAVCAGDPNGADTFNPAVEWDGFVIDTFDDLGTHTATCTLSVGVIESREIWQIQGSGAASPFAGQRAGTENNIVTALSYSTGMPNGFFIQTPDSRADASNQTSNGIYVFTGSTPSVNVGDQVDVTGSVSEFFGLTELSNATVTVDSSGNPLPAAVLFTQVNAGEFVPSHDQPFPANEYERFEGMRVRVMDGRTSAPSDRFGDAAMVADDTRAFREPGLLYPGVPGYPVLWDGNPEVFEINPDGAGLPDASFPAGSVIQVAEGPLTYSFDDYQIWPTTLSYTKAVIPRPVRARHPGEMTVASQNMLRFFDADATNGPNDGPVTPAQFRDRVAKASLHIRTVLRAPDILSLEEVENIAALISLANRIEADDPSIRYTAYLLEGNDIGGIDTGVLVRDTINVTAQVTQVGLTTRLSLDGSRLNDRPPLVLQGEYVGNGAPFPITVIGVHGRSLSGIEGTGSSANRVRQKRLEQATELAQYIQSLQAADRARRIVVTGDFNAFEFSDGFVDVVGIMTGHLDPKGAIQPGHADHVEPNLVNQVNSLPASERYSFVFGGSAQVLDHMLTTANLDRYVRTLQYARGNADGPISFQADPTTPVAMSDHDGEVLFIMTDYDADRLPDDVDNCAVNPNPSQEDFDLDSIGDSCDVDDDNDFVLDVVDACRLSGPVQLFVTIGSCTTHAVDVILKTGCSITDSILGSANGATNHRQFVSSVTLLADALRKDGLISDDAKSALTRCAAWANLP